MKRIRRSKAPTVTQMKNIVHNLKLKYPKGYVALHYQETDFKTGHFWLNVEKVHAEYIDLWNEVYEVYDKLMKGTSNG